MAQLKHPFYVNPHWIIDIERKRKYGPYPTQWDAQVDLSKMPWVGEDASIVGENECLGDELEAYKTEEPN
jgi:hypothetical protein